MSKVALAKKIKFAVGTYDTLLIISGVKSDVGAPAKSRFAPPLFPVKEMLNVVEL